MSNIQGARAMRRMAGLGEDLLWHARHARVVIAVVLAVCIGLRVAPQAQDVLVVLGQAGSAGAWALTFVSTLWLGLNAWFWSRFTLALHDRHEFAEVQAMSPARQERRARLRLWLPRALGVAPFFGLAWAMWQASFAIPSDMQAMMSDDDGALHLRIAAGVIACFGIAVFRGLAQRRRWLRRAHDRLIARGVRPDARLADALDVSLLPDAAEITQHRLGAGGVTVLCLTAVVAALGATLTAIDPVSLGQLLQPVPTLLFAASGLLSGGSLLAWYGARTRTPLIAMLILSAVALAALRDADLVPDNHDIRLSPGPLPARPDIETAFGRFLDTARRSHRPGAPVPVVLVATGGGGLAAAFWTATVLGDLADHAPGFADHLFAISGVSGGSLGALELVSVLNDPTAASRLACPTVRRCAQAALGADFLGPVLGSMLYTDFLQRFVPAPVFDDRAVALERAWEVRWRETTGDNRLAGPFLGLWPAQRPWPALLLNSTSVLTGDRVITSNLALAGRGTDDSIGAGDLLAIAGQDVPASSAAGHGARFPYFGPVGAVRRGPGQTGREAGGQAGGQAGGEIADLVVDGGYFEAYGATTLLDTLNALEAISRRDQRNVRYIVLQLVSDPALTVAEVRRPGLSLVPRGVSAPLETLLHSRRARGAAATEALARRVAELGGLYVPIHLGFSPTGAAAPLSWSLSSVARQVIDGQWSEGCRDRLIAEMALQSPGTPLPRDFMSMLSEAPCAPRAPLAR